MEIPICAPCICVSALNDTPLGLFDKTNLEVIFTLKTYPRNAAIKSNIIQYFIQNVFHDPPDVRRQRIPICRMLCLTAKSFRDSRILVYFG